MQQIGLAWTIAKSWLSIRPVFLVFALVSAGIRTYSSRRFFASFDEQMLQNQVRNELH